MTFRLECGCHIGMEDGELNEPCLVHEHEQITPLEAMVMVFRTRLMDESDAEALAFIQQKRDEINGGDPVWELPERTA